MAGDSLSSGKGAISLSIEEYGKSFASINDYLKSISDQSIPVYKAGGKTYTIKYTGSALSSATFVEVQPKSSSKASTDNSDGALVKYNDPSQIKFNLPPHEWSLPLDRGRTSTQAYSDTKVDHAQRRALMWFYGGADTTTGANLLLPTNSIASQTPAEKTYSSNVQDNFWGFQFLWNPQSVQNVLTRNSNVVPSALDAYAELNGLFTAMEALQFTITIDRVNDFACAKSFYASTAKAGISNATFAPYYRKGGNPGVLQDFPTQFKELMTMGTMADIEYIYRMINGSGQNGGKWVNGLGRKTADLGFLSPTAVGLRFGPGPDSLSYVGWIESLNVNHTMFTQDMIPIHSEVTVSFNAFSRVSLTGLPTPPNSHRTTGGR